MNREFHLPSLYHNNEGACLVIAHRGASSYYPENTMVSFKAAVEMEADMVELDVMLSKDGVPVIFHDAQLNVHTNGAGFVNRYTLKELKQLDAGSWLHPRFQGEQIPALEEALSFLEGKAAVNIEIKTEGVTDNVRGGIEEKCLELVRKYGMQKHVLFSSFDYRAIAHLKVLEPRIPVALLYDRFQSGKKSPSELLAEYRADAFNCSYTQLNKKRKADLRAHKIPNFVYTINRPRKMKKLVEAGVNGIFTDKPDLLKKVVEQCREQSQDTSLR